MTRQIKQIKCTNGEVIPFEIFFKEYFSKFYVFATRFIDDVHACEDLVQETFIALWENDNQEFESENMIHAYIYRSIRNKAINYLKHHKIKLHYTQEFLKHVEEEEYMMVSVVAEELYYQLYEAIKGLTPQCRRVIKLHLEGMDNKEIAEEMKISISTVKSHKMLAYSILRSKVEKAFEFVVFFM